MVYVSNLSLFVWFFLDMTGLRVNDRLLVSQAYREDGVFFLIFLGVFCMFVFTRKVGGRALLVWLSLWFLTQFLSHWRFTVFGPAEEKIEFFSGTIKLIHSDQTYIPDLYHLVLHFLILVSLISVGVYLNRKRRFSG